MLSEIGIDAEVIDLRSLTPIDIDTLATSVARTGRLVVSDTGHTQFGVTAEVIAAVSERSFADLRAAPRRVALPHIPTPTSPALADAYYPRAIEIAQAAASMFDAAGKLPSPPVPKSGPWLDVPDTAFTGPY